MQKTLTVDMILAAYAAGIFPMAKRRTSKNVFWVDPLERGILPLEDFHTPRRLKRTIRSGRFEVKINTAFKEVMLQCAASKPGRKDTWINDEIISVYTELHTFGHAHSIEVWDESALVGGLYGVSLGHAFFGESMFSHRRDASKVALVSLVEKLKEEAYLLLDIQFLNEHLQQFGALQVSREEYQRRLKEALSELPVDSAGPQAWQQFLATP